MSREMDVRVLALKSLNDMISLSEQTPTRGFWISMDEILSYHAALTAADAASPSRQAPPFDTTKGLQFYAKDSDGQWYYVNHANTWQTCSLPVDEDVVRDAARWRYVRKLQPWQAVSIFERSGKMAELDAAIDAVLDAEIAALDAMAGDTKT